MTDAPSPDYRFLRRPLWLAGAGLAVAGIVVFVGLGLWQLDRLAGKRAFNDLLTSRLAEPPASLDSLLAGGDPGAARFRRTVVTGTFDASAEVLLAGRTDRGRPGYHVLTPLVVGAGEAVIVDRGWVSIDVEGPPVASAPPPAGTVTVTGVVDTAPGGRVFGSPGPDGTVERIGAVDLARLDQQVPERLYPVYVTLDAVDGDTPAQPVAAGPVELSEGPHLGYAVQWFLFASVVLVGFPILVYRTARSSQNVPRTSPRQANGQR